LEEKAMKMKMVFLAVFTFVAQFGVAQNIGFTEANPSKLFVSYGPAGAFIKTGNTNASFGGGSALTLGWYFNNDLALYVTSKGFHMDKSAFRDADPEAYFRWGVNGVGVRYSVMNWGRTHLYLDGAFLQSSIRPDRPEKIIFSGNGFSTGFGLQHFVAREWSISSDIMYVYSHFGKQVEGRRTSDFDANGHGINISIRFSWHPFANQNTE
jgi:hypothetical protein